MTLPPPPPARMCEWSPTVTLRLQRFVAWGQGLGGTGSWWDNSSHLHLLPLPPPRKTQPPPSGHWGAISRAELRRLHEWQRLCQHTQCPWQLSPHVCCSLKTGRNSPKLREPPKSSQELHSALVGSEAPRLKRCPSPALASSAPQNCLSG